MTPEQGVTAQAIIMILGMIAIMIIVWVSHPSCKG